MADSYAERKGQLSLASRCSIKATHGEDLDDVEAVAGPESLDASSLLQNSADGGGNAACVAARLLDPRPGAAGTWRSVWRRMC